MAPSFFKNSRLLRNMDELYERIGVLMQSAHSFPREIEDARQALLYEQIDYKLRGIPAEVLREYKTGARLQAISGFNIREIQLCSVEQLASFRGIGRASAQLIKDCASDYAKRVIQDHKLRIWPDNRTTNATKLVRKLLQYDKMMNVAANAIQLNKKLVEYKGILEQAKISTNPIRWLFSRNKDIALESIERIEALLQGPLVKELEELEGKKKQIDNITDQECWSAFRNDPSRFYALLSGVRHQNNNSSKSWPIQNTTKQEEDVFSPELRKQIEHVELNIRGLRCILRPYQLFGVKYILNQRNVLLGDEMGLGKTIEAIAAMVSLRNNGAKHFVVVCPASILVNWEREITKHSDMRCFILHGSDYNINFQRWVSQGGIAVTNYESTALYKYSGYVAMTVVDEAHYIKNRMAARTQNTIAILNKSNRKLFMTGTPLENRLDEMVSLIELLQPEIASKIRMMSRVSKERFRHVVAPVYFRRTKDSVWEEMPELQVIEDVIELTNAERYRYIGYVRERTMAAFVKMRQISFMMENDRDSSKLTRIKEVCGEAIANGRKVIIFSYYLNTIDRIRKSFGMATYGPITGSILPETRQTIIDQFSEHEGGAVLLAQIMAGGTGLNIQKASIVIMCEPQYKPSIENQAIARAYRIGQMSNVTVYRLLGARTVDERILQILKEKQAIFDAYADKSESGERSLQVKESDIAALEFANSKIG